MVVDASVMVAVFHAADPFHQQSRAWLLQYLLGRGVLFAPILLLSEVAGALARRTGDPGIGWQAAKHLWSLRSLTIVDIREHFGHESYRAAAELRLRDADAVYVALAEMLSVPLVTWDQEQYQRGRLWVSTLHPGEPLPQ